MSDSKNQVSESMSHDGTVWCEIKLWQCSVDSEQIELCSKHECWLGWSATVLGPI